MRTTNAPPAAHPWTAFRAGLARMVRAWPLVVLFYAAAALLAGLILLPAARALTGWIGYNLTAAEIAGGLPAWVIIEELMSLTPAAGGAAPAGDWPFFLLLSLPAWPLLLAVPATILSAGAIAVYAGAAPRAAGAVSEGGERPWKRMGSGLRRYACPFLLLLLLEVVLYELALLLTVLLTVVVVIVTGSLWSILAVTPILALVIALLPWWFEYARTIAVVAGQRNVWRALGRSWTWIWHNLGPAAALALYHLLLLLAPYLLSFGLNRVVPGAWWGARIVVQQAVVAAVLGVRLARMAGQVALVQSRPQPLAPTAADL